MHKTRQAITMVLALSILSFGLTATQAQPRRRPIARSNEAQTRQLVDRLETGAERFRASLDESLDQSRTDGTRREDNINDSVDDFVRVIDQLRDRSERRTVAASDIEAVLARASRIDTFVSRNRLTPRAQSDWAAVRVDLNELSRLYNVAWRRDSTETFPPYPPANDDYNYDRGLTGTYRLNASLSENPRTEADRATRSLPLNERRRTNNEIVARLEAPDALAIERRGNSVTIASTRAPQITFDADGREQFERDPDGDSVRARATFYGDQLTVSTTGDRDRDFSVSFNPLNNGRRLLVTRRITVANLREPVTVRSYYDRTADVAQFDIYKGTNTLPSDTTGRRDDDFAIANNTTLIATLNNDLSTKDAREGDRFTMTVREPSQYSGATIEGTITNVKRSGRVSGRAEFTFNFDRIRLNNGRTYRFAGLVESVRSGEGETVRVDNEGSVQEGDSQTDRTVQRTAIGTAVGAIIGAIAGGGKGAAIGAVIGAGGGAGSVYAQGQDDLELRRGTEVTIRTSGPR